MIGARSSKDGTLVFDANAAKATLAKRGFGRAKRSHRSYLWLQQKINAKKLELRNVVGTKRNPADLGTEFEWMELKYEDSEHRMTLHM